MLNKDNNSVEILKNVILMSPVSVALLDRNMHYITASKTWGEKYGFSFASTMVGKSHYDIFPIQVCHWQEKFDNCLKGETYAGNEEEITDLHDNKMWVTLNITPWFSSENKVGGLIVHIIDLTEKFKAAADLEKMIDNLKQTNLQLDRFAHICSHDLREPLRSVSGFVQLLVLHNSGNFDDTSIEYIQHILKILDRMKLLIKDILSYSRIPTQMVNYSVVDLGYVINEVKNDLLFRLEEAGAEIHISHMPQIMGDATQIRQLFTNLIENAIKYRSERPLVIDISAKIVGSYCQISIKDNGIGIDPEFQDTIFDMFKRLHGKDHYEGSGIGLAICKKIVNAHNGEIYVRSNPTGGCEFIFTLSM